MYSIKGFINRLGVIAGPWQFGKIDQGIVGFWVGQFVYNGPLGYIGFGAEGKQVRDVIHIDDVCDLILGQIQNIDLVNHRTFNIGGGRKNTFSLLELTRLVASVTGSQKNIDTIKEGRKGDIRIYMTDNAEIKGCIGWYPKRSLSDVVEDTYGWINEHQSLLENILKPQRLTANK